LIAFASAPDPKRRSRGPLMGGSEIGRSIGGIDEIDGGARSEKRAMRS
jgi:hypothetical protein